MAVRPQAASAANASTHIAHPFSTNKLIFRAIAGIASASLLLRFFGMLNQVVVSTHFGAGADMDAYIVAASLPGVAASIVTTTIEFSLAPVYGRARARGEQAQTSTLFSTLLNLFFLAATLCTLIALLFRRELLFLIAPALDASRMALAVALAPFIFPIFMMQVLLGLIQSILNMEGKFGLPAYAAILVPLCTMVWVLFAPSDLGIVILCFGALAGSCCQLLVLAICIRTTPLRYRLVIDWRNPDVRSILVIGWPALLGALVVQASGLIDQVFASFLSAGTISALTYALKIVSVPVGIIFVAVGQAALPFLSHQAAAEDMQGFKATLRLYLWLIVLSTFAFTAGLLVLAHPVVQILFERGAFTANAANLTATILRGFAVGLAPMGAVFLLEKGVSALGSTRQLMYAGVLTVVANAVFDYIFARLWQGFGIALATSLVYMCNAVYLVLALRHRAGQLDLLTPPTELVNALHRVEGTMVTRIGGLRQLLGATERQLHWGSSYFFDEARRRRALWALCIVLAAFALGVASAFVNTVVVLVVALALPVALVALRYPFLVLLLVALTYALVGSPFPAVTHLDWVLIPLMLLVLPGLRIRQAIKQMPALVLLVMFLIWMLAGIGVSPLDPQSFLRLWVVYVSYAAVSMITVCTLTTRRRVMALIDCTLLTSSAIGLFGIVGYFTRQYGGFDSQFGAFRITSVFASAPGLALFLCMALPLSIYRALATHGIRRTGTLLMSVVLLVAIMLTFTREIFISIPISIVVVALCLPSRRARYSLLAGFVGLTIVVAGAALVTGLPVLGRFTSANTASLSGRTYLWAALLERFDPGHIVGYGLGAGVDVLTKLHIGANGLVWNGLIATSPSNLFVQVLYDHGIIGLLLVLGIFAALLIRLLRGLRASTGEHYALFVVALVTLLIMFFESLEQSDFMTQQIAVYFWIVMALPFAAYWTQPQALARAEAPALSTTMSGPTAE